MDNLNETQRKKQKPSSTHRICGKCKPFCARALGPMTAGAPVHALASAACTSKSRAGTFALSVHLFSGEKLSQQSQGIAPDIERKTKWVQLLLGLWAVMCRLFQAGPCLHGGLHWLGSADRERLLGKLSVPASRQTRPHVGPCGSSAIMTWISLLTVFLLILLFALQSVK